MLEDVVSKMIESETDYIIRNAIDFYVKPKLNSIKSKFTNDASEVVHFSIQFEDYLNRMYKKSGNLTTIILHRIPASIEKLYVPLTLQSEQQSINDFVVNKDISNFISTYNRIIITDSAGMGKSTIMKWMFQKSLEEGKTVPIFIELRKLTKDTQIIGLICRELNCINKEIDEDIVMQMISTGDFTFFFDGYDEIILEEKNNIILSLQEFIDKAYKNNFIITSRPEPSLASFASFYNFKVQPLELRQAFELIKKYAKLDGRSSVIDNLIADINDQKNFSNLEPFLTNPLMVCLLYKGYDYKPQVPLKKHLFYRQVYDALFEMHDLSKGGAFSRIKECGLDIDSFHTIMRTLAFLSFIQNKVEYTSKDEIVQLIKNACKIVKIEVEPSLLLNDLVTTVPLFYEEGYTYRWAHKSLQEYFVACYFHMDATEKLADIYEKQLIWRYYNVLDICYDMKYKSFRNYLISKLLNDLKKNLENLDNKEYQIDFYIELYVASFPNVEENFTNLEVKEDRRKQMLDFAHKIGKKSWGSNIRSAHPIQYLWFYSSEYHLMDILYSKGEKFIKKHEPKIEDIRFDYALIDKLLGFLKSIDENFMIRVHIDDPIWKNKQELFDIAFSLFCISNMHPVYYVDFEELLVQINQIEQDKQIDELLNL